MPSAQRVPVGKCPITASSETLKTNHCGPNIRKIATAKAKQRETQTNLIKVKELHCNKNAKKVTLALPFPFPPLPLLYAAPAKREEVRSESSPS